MKCTEIILASASPRRIKMFKKHGFDPVVIPSDYEERIHDFLTPEETVMFLALQKGLSVLRSLRCTKDSLIVSADTIVVDHKEKKILGKPKSEKEAYDMLSSLSGRSHHVLTGVCLISAKQTKYSCTPLIQAIRCFFESSKVFFIDIPDDELRAYVKTSEPYDKAGGYAIQETFGRYTEHIEGDLDNIIGFPFSRFLKEAEDYL